MGLKEKKKIDSGYSFTSWIVLFHLLWIFIFLPKQYSEISSAIFSTHSVDVQVHV